MKTEIIKIRVAPEKKEQIVEAAKNENRSMSNYITKAVDEELKRKTNKKRLVEIGDYYIDINTNNKWDTERYSLKMATEAAESLRSCHDCTNCEDCYLCESCKDCKGCTGCLYCVKCDNCSNCRMCSDCIHCKNSVHIDHNANIENVYNKLEEEVVEEYASPLKEMFESK